MAKRITIYADEGAGDFSVFCTRDFFGAENVTLCKAPEVIDGTALRDCDLFVMPGGADLPYCHALNGAGNARIRAYVEAGGTYLGICAGAYYGCRDIAYHAGRADEITGPRELAFIDATAYGSLPDLAGYYDETLATAAWITLCDAGGHRASSFYHGGCAFDVRDPDAEILARFADLPGQPPAVIARQVGGGRAILSGAHIEARPHHFGAWAWDAADKTRAAGFGQSVTDFFSLYV